MKKINLTFLFIISIIFISLIASDVFSASKIYNIKETKQLGETIKISSIQKSSQEIKDFLDFNTSGQDVKIIESNYTLSFVYNLSETKTLGVASENINKSFESSLDVESLIKKNSQIPIHYNISLKKEGQKVKISDFIVPETKFPFEKKEQPIINPTLEETIILKVQNEIKKKKETIDPIPSKKSIPEIINQEVIKPEKLIVEIEKNSEFKKNYEYAKKIGYTKLVNSTKIKYNNGKESIVSILLSEDNKDGIFLVYLVGNLSENGPNVKSYLSKLRKENDTVILTMFGEDWGVELDLINRSMIAEWGHHSCGYGQCVGYCFEWWLEISWIGSLCGDFCYGTFGCITTLLVSGGNPLFIPECLVCAACMSGAGVGCLGTCGVNSCSWYPCLTDCNDYDGYYGSSWEYYCSGSNQRKHRLYYNFYCSSNDPQEGSCQYNSYYVNDTFVQSCPYGCANGQCKEQVVCYSDLGCGTDSWVGSPYCSGGDVWQYYREYNCHYPGTENSYCTYSQGPEKKQDCTSGTCDSGQCVGDVYCQQQNPSYPFYCSTTPGTCYSCSDNNQYSVCCPNSGAPQYCCPNSGPFCNQNTGDCTTCGGNYPFECNNDCWGCLQVPF